VSAANDDGAFGPWHPLTADDVAAHAPDEPGAVQLRRADASLVQYPRGRSAMVFYFYAARSVREALRRLFRDELDEPGARGEGALAFRWSLGGPATRSRIEALYERFVDEFGRAPSLHPGDDDEEG
jgi:hypothetical protein